MLYSQSESNDQSGVSAVLNDVRNNSNIYDVVALNSAGGLVGSLTSNGHPELRRLGPGDQQLRPEQRVGLLQRRIHLRQPAAHRPRRALRARARELLQRQQRRHSFPANFGGIQTVNPNGFNGTYGANVQASHNPINFTVGANYTVSPRLSLYVRYAESYQTEGLNDPRG